ncbi:MAG TPA: polyprenyl synthetase family protein [Streptosporangiaceae bacterium]
MDYLQEKLACYNKLLDERLRQIVKPQPPAKALYQMMAYHFGWLNRNLEPVHDNCGKRVRPFICLLVCESLTGSPAAALPGALAVELIHNFSLVHDDIEDASLLRRRRPTVWAVWGMPQAVNVGDGLFTLAHLALTDGTLEPGQARDSVRLLARTCRDLCEGQFLDLTMRTGPDPGLPQYLAMAERKTGALFGCAAKLGAIMGGAPDGVITALGDFGLAIGEAFQMQDDILGVWGDETVTGKPALDICERKLGIPAVLAWQRAEPADLARLSALYSRPAPLDAGEESWIRGLFERLGARAQAEAMVQERLRRAEKLLDEALAGAPMSRELHDFISLITTRDG